MRQTFQRIMSAITFAEAGEHETARSLMFKDREAPKAVDGTETKGIGISEKAQQYMKAITFAEEGEHEYARATLEEIQPTPALARAKSILVLGREDTFADYLVNYAIDMADRFGYEIVALNALPLSRKTRLLSGFADEIGEQFQNNAHNAGAAFRRKAEEKGIAFHHEIRLMSEQKALRTLHREKPNIEFVLTEPEPVAPEQAPEFAGSVCVCSFVG